LRALAETALTELPDAVTRAADPRGVSFADADTRAALARLRRWRPTGG
jgi:hypothetical protein